MIPSDIEKLKQAFGDREFTGKDVARVLEMKTWHGSGAMLKSMRRAKLIYATTNGWCFGTPPQNTQPAPVEAPIVSTLPIVAPVIEPPPIMPSLVRIGELFIHERTLLIADHARQEASDAVRLYTTIIEVDPATKHPRNKIINFLKSRDPREYAQAIAWLDGLAGDPHAADDTALELAADLEKQLNAARKENADLKSKLEAIQGMLRGAL